MSIAEQLAAIGGFGPEELIWIERDLAYASTELGSRGNINWSRHFPWPKGKMSELQGHRCCWCDRRMTDAGPPDKRPTFEHIEPLSKGGLDEPANMAIACDGCNNGRGSEDAICEPTIMRCYALAA